MSETFAGKYGEVNLTGAAQLTFRPVVALLVIDASQQTPNNILSMARLYGSLLQQDILPAYATLITSPAMNVILESKWKWRLTIPFSFPIIIKDLSAPITVVTPDSPIARESTKGIKCADELGVRQLRTDF